MDQVQVTVTLHDFHIFHHDHDGKHSSPEQQVQPNNFSKLKQKLRGETIPFSMNFNVKQQISIDTHDDQSDVYIFDVEIVHERNLLIFGTNSMLNFYQLETRQKLKSINLVETLTIHDLVVDGKYLYLTSEYKLQKYDLDELLRIEDKGNATPQSLIWTSSPEEYLNNCWGLALHSMNGSKYVYVMDYTDGIFVFDSETGNFVQTIECPTFKKGYGIVFTPDDEMIVTTSNREECPIQIFKFNSSLAKWEITRQVNRNIANFKSPYGICYERKTRLIYVLDIGSENVFVIGNDNNNNMELVHTWYFGDLGEVEGYGIVLDEKRGKLYLPFIENSKKELFLLKIG